VSLDTNRGLPTGFDSRIERLERPPVVTLTTDFGVRDGYVGTMKGVIHALLPDAKIVDISHDIEPQSIHQGAFILYRAYRYFPASSVHVAVVDPGVGADRRPIALVTRHGTFVGPDNGIFTYVLRAEQAPDPPGREGRAPWVGGMWGVAPRWAGTPSEDAQEQSEDEQHVGGHEPRAYHIANPDYWLSSVSNTFHGRDIFAPVAAHLASGAHPGRMGEEVPLSSLTELPTSAPRIARAARGATVMSGQIVYLDHFGNIITNLPERLLEPLIAGAGKVTVEVGGYRISGLGHTYADVGEGQPVALMGSERLLEVAVRNASAAQRLKVRIGDPVRIVVEKDVEK
jgi:S-adenosyl-L-methionine hydrolase (adenosine-forming)